ncbi:TetR/AcrR family transcriptional regulator [Gloeocapsopsis sp. IPPAS B-1203]|uniref:TetR/AcrR family transcriptional regulator n=1 Tax=Gloeocapsopsis sp. IPPAS B-1203 TaxID=2049454 RepID=UPI000C17E9B5|nr:TetR/AcrR family transcriptional regulator [Gloeocapsopsis sp. IPPAS B-1203]PIG91652.1 TetR family transcriptional regulator [Gloeocapsopsis sp. IPPAS B-1203]
MKSTSPKKSVRDRILDAALELFYQKGIQHVGVDEIVAHSGVAKMSLYNHFHSKDQLVAEFLRRRDENWRRWFEATVEQYGKTPFERLLAMFDALKDWFEQPNFRGCAFINATVELVNSDHPGYQVALEHKQALYQYILKLTQAAAIKNAESLARQLLLLIEGAIVLALMEKRSDAAGQARAAALALLTAQSYQYRTSGSTKRR